ncbi:unnamed protein product [Rotaria socialis]|uniref:Uncharacterized protein n=1 Tax=Rotaria socialis TaxID=392032 RepID=A0A820RYA5_9BILA|nr:unnamed protein product [Rotaria socialis]CAF3664486.1 unnamed protein product [Rotaria socialis]CAF4275793.1 unnamed protein product [Rotaria socialis]CAF4444910.1 unnamed protein product [Rotaria socialis]
MNIQLGYVFHQTITATSDTNISSNDGTQCKNNSTKKTYNSHVRREKKPHIIIDMVTPKLSQSSSTQHERTILVEASSANFGNECLRLVNIVFQTNRKFPSIMGTRNSICQYLRKELFKKMSQ